MDHQRDSRSAARGALAVFAACTLALAIASASAFVAPVPQTAAKEPTFDELYRRGQAANAGLKTLTARFTETTTSSLLTRPLVERGTLAVQRPSTVVLNYAVPDARTVLIDGERLILSWPERGIHQERNIRQIQGRVQKYFVDSEPDELRQSFDITISDAEKHAGTDHIVLMSKRPQIREGLTRLD
jgi:outer membrane lipoprotein-sorting protein